MSVYEYDETMENVHRHPDSEDEYMFDEEAGRAIRNQRDSFVAAAIEFVSRQHINILCSAPRNSVLACVRQPFKNLFF